MDRPRVIVNTLASLDGRVSLGPNRTGFEDAFDERWQRLISAGESLEERARRLERQHRPQAFLEGSGSFVRDADEPARLPPIEGNAGSLYEDFLPEAVVARPGHRGWFAAVDGRGRLRSGMKEFEGWPGWHTLHLTSSAAAPEYLAFLRREQIPYLVAGRDRVDLPVALGKLKALLGVTCLVSTAGARLNGALLRAGLVDDVYVEIFPAIIGGKQTPALFDAPDLAPGQWPTSLRLISTEAHADGRVWLRYEVLGPVAGG